MLASLPIWLSLISWSILYILVSLREGSYVNFLTPALFIFVPTHYVFELAYIAVYNHDVNIVTYTYLYAMYFIVYAVFVFGYYCSQSLRPYTANQVKVASSNNVRYAIIAVLLSLLGFLIYYPILKEFSQYLFTPRVIYEKTRTGFGIYFFVSLMFSQLALMFCFYVRKWWITFVVVLGNILLLLLHGNKTPIFAMFISYLLYLFYVKGKRVDFKKLVLFLSVISIIVSIFFSLTFKGSEGLIVKMANYSDYTRNSALVIDSDYESNYGKLLLESQVFSRIPRAIFPDKPSDFGYFRLTKEFFPERFKNNQGMPSFGFGEYYADFGGLTIIVVSVLFFVKGITLGFFRNRLAKDANIYNFIPFAFLCDINIIPTGSGWLFLEHIALAAFAYLLIKVKASYVR